VTSCRVRISRADFDRLTGHLFPGDNDEHGAVLLAGLSNNGAVPGLLVREVHLAAEGSDYVEGTYGYRALAPAFIHRLITRARDEKLAYLAVHNHISDRSVGFSSIDMESHERGYPALLQIARGMPVGALVFGRRSVECDIWWPDGRRSDLERAVVVGNTILRLQSRVEGTSNGAPNMFERQVRMFGSDGQRELGRCCVGIIGLGGVGSLVAEYLARLGVGEFYLIDSDRVETSNVSRIVGASLADAQAGAQKTAVAKRLILSCNEGAQVHVYDDDVANELVAKQLSRTDYLFLAADSMRARLTFNAIIHQYLIPGVQLGAKVRSSTSGQLADVMSVIRPVRPGVGCLWCNQLIDPTQLAIEAKTDEDRLAQAYGTQEPNPSVITLNAVAAAHGVNDFLLDYLGLRDETEVAYQHFHFLSRKQDTVDPRMDWRCPECAATGFRYARGDGVQLPVLSD
jgi:hypothetical protein